MIGTREVVKLAAVPTQPVVMTVVTSVDAPPAELDLSSSMDLLIDRVTANQQDAVDTMENAGAALFDGLTRTNRRIAEFASERLRQDLEARQAFLSCKTFDELRSLQGRFLKTAVDQYASETARMIRLGGEMLAKSVDRGAG